MFKNADFANCLQYLFLNSRNLCMTTLLVNRQ